MSPAPHPRMHGLTHVPGGPDPIPGLFRPPVAGSYRDSILAVESLWGFWPLSDVSGDFQNLVDDRDLNVVDTVLHPMEYSLDGPFPPDTAAGFDGLDSSVTPNEGTHADLTLTAPEIALLFGTTESFTWEGWIYPTAAGQNGYVASLGDLAGLTWGVRLIAGELTAVRGGIDIMSGVNPPVDEWSHIALTYDGTDLRLYDGGVEVGSITSGSVTGEETFQIGRQTTTGGSSVYFTGRMYGHALYTEALDASTLATHAGFDAGATVEAGDVLQTDGAGGTTWGPVGPASLEPGSEGQLLTTSGDEVVWADAPSPLDDTQVWMPLTTVSAGVPELVWDSDDQLIPTITPI